ncbi:MAG: hypothetical protein BWK76_16535 [Desulfobulbaceae bacterium A2]|nr:MAG: hypothetical protein BWK76_16535 [Desulfobulbaceae bacterium A2]
MHSTPSEASFNLQKQLRRYGAGTAGLLLTLCTAANAGATAHAAWAEINGQGVEVRYSLQGEQGWSTAQSLSGDAGIHITPAMATDQSGTVWVVWVERGTDGYILHYNAIDNGTVTADGTIPSPCTRNYAPTVLVDESNTLWAAWGGFDGQDEDIYASFWDGVVWSPPQLVHEGNDVPDILPVLGQGDNGHAWISWTKLQNNQSYTVHALWDGAAWSPPQADSFNSTSATTQFQSGDVSAAAATTASAADRLPAMPAQAASRIMGVMTMPGAGPVQSLSDRIVPLR